ncbi:PREDICTED: THO complex subunit 5 homolog [Priapulus caudatus]|uniref:THO complex subunit 5 homolog n=1 Tax=Priapulus caudatus TaxID=37621 RepID=A0ABM1FBH3_PRICU|nr:PREDICTED: THO complex subunit 5 homolog [Priapulus caudatus]
MSSGTANISIKKRRKPREGKEVVRDARETIMQTKKAKVDEILENPLTWEDEDASARDPAQDAEVHSETCQEIRHLLARIHKLRQAGSSTDDEALQEDKIQLALLGINLKKLNRLGQIRCRISRESTSEAKYRVDSLHLQLQNLLYELMHLQKEITKCLQFKSADEEIDIVPVDEFYVEAPPSISRPDVTKSDKHQQYLSRLEWEREQRRRLAENCKEIKATKEETARQIQEKQAQLDSLLPRFKAILKATQPIQESLGMRLDEKRQQQETARYLPSPLYILYVQADAYREACDEKLCVTVEGIMEEVRSFQDDREDFDEDSAESDQEEAQAEKRHRSKSRMSKLADEARRSC